ncbi:MAG TPA: right-handed parallel beta-helix repeat-containing protein, partial [Bacillota bacterium]|nr:right-handed parallel beta-helix repeat-containing protein [Bacillota bacterium]
YVVVLLILALGWVGQNFVKAAPILSDDFEDGNSNGWSKSGGSWSVATDGTRVFKQSSTSSNAYAYTGDSAWSNYTVEARVKALSFQGTARSLGLTARYTSTSNYYYLTLGNDNQLKLGIKASSGSKVLAAKNFAVAVGNWYTLKLVVNDSRLEGYVDNVLQLTVSDSTFITGKVGVMALYTSAEFDDFLVDGAISPSPSPTSTLEVSPSLIPTSTIDVSPSPMKTATTLRPTATSVTFYPNVVSQMPILTLQDVSGNPLAGQTITWSASITGITFLNSNTSVTDASGATSVNIQIPASALNSSFDVTVTYSGDATHHGSSCNIYVKIIGALQPPIVVAPNGTDNNPGTVDLPTSLKMAILRIQPGGIIYMRGGTYIFSTQVTIENTNNGNASSLKKILPYGSEKPILDFSSQPYISNEVNPRGMRMDGSYWHIQGLEIKGAADNGMYISGNHNTIELCVFHHNRDSGLQLGRYSEAYTSISQWPSYNLILNCDSYANDDPDNHEDADGFGCKLTTGYGNVFRGCFAHHNNDDGWDLFMKPETGVIGPVTLEDCVAWANGYHLDGSSSPGDGNGFKLGGNGMPCDNILIRCIAVQNRVKGFWGNGNGGTMTVTNCTGYDNKDGGNFRFDKGTHIFKNNLSYLSPDTDYHYGTDVDNSNVWWKSNGNCVNAKGLVVNASDFVSLAPTFNRNADGSLNLGNFLKLAPGSDLIGAGTPAGTDLGARGH